MTQMIGDAIIDAAFVTYGDEQQIVAEAHDHGAIRGVMKNLGRTKILVSAHGSPEKVLESPIGDL